MHKRAELDRHRMIRAGRRGLLVLCAAGLAGLAGPASAGAEPEKADDGRVMPRVVDKGLAAAASSLGYDHQVTVNDLSGAKRHVQWPTEWKVCTQSPAKGTKLAESTKVELGVVRTTEDCPK